VAANSDASLSVRVRADGWKQLCAELSIDPDVLLRGQPGFDTLVRFEEQVRPIAFNAEEASACCRERVARRHGGKNEPSGSGREYRLVTAADVARSMREFLEKRRDACWMSGAKSAKPAIQLMR
jgi:hypothetical protein